MDRDPSDTAREIKRLVQLAHQQFSELDPAYPLDRIEPAMIRQLAEPGSLLRNVWALQNTLDEIQGLQLSLAVAEVPIGALPPELLAFYTSELPRIRQLVDDAARIMTNEMIDMGEGRAWLAVFLELGSRERQDELSESEAIRKFISSVVEDAVDPEFGNPVPSPEEPEAMALSLVRAEFFRPDVWWNNSRELRPVMVASSEVGLLPRHVRSALREAHQSYIFGNGRAVAALCRSILEAALLERGKALGFETLTTHQGRERPRRLCDLARDLEERHPELDAPLGLIVDYGNDVMHSLRPDPRPSFVMLYAKRSLDALRIVLEKLYSS